jgi:hypothetical protein
MAAVAFWRTGLWLRAAARQLAMLFKVASLPEKEA